MAQQAHTVQLLTNFEALAFLNAKRTVREERMRDTPAHLLPPRGKEVVWVERRVRTYLQNTPAAKQTREGVLTCLKAIDKMSKEGAAGGPGSLSTQQKVQLVNHAFTDSVGLYLITRNAYQELEAEGKLEGLKDALRTLNATVPPPMEAPPAVPLAGSKRPRE